jgi:hypothetical protein
MSGWICEPRSFQALRERHAHTFSPGPVSSLRGLHGHLSHIPLADAARQLPIGLTTSSTGYGTGGSPSNINVLKSTPDATKAPASTPLRGANPVGRHSSVSQDSSRKTSDLVDCHKSTWKEESPDNDQPGPSP